MKTAWFRPSFRISLVLSLVLTLLSLSDSIAASVGDELLSWTNNWRFKGSAGFRSSDWARVDFDDSKWTLGKGVFRSPATLAVDNPGSTVGFGFTGSVLFRTTVVNPVAAEGLLIRCEHMIKDGARFYLNGREISRFNLREGATVQATTDPLPGTNASKNDFVFPAAWLNSPTNVLAVELHRRSFLLANTTPLTFGIRLSIVPAGFPSATLASSNSDLLEGDPLLLEANVEGLPPLLLQWFRNGTPIANATNRVLDLPHVELNFHGGFYQLWVTNESGVASSPLARVRVFPNRQPGAFDPSFQARLMPVAESTPLIVGALKVLKSRRIMVGGLFGGVDGNTNYMGLARLHPDGSLDATFRPQMINGSDSSPVRSIEELPDGKLLVAGRFDAYNGKPSEPVIRLHSDGRLDTDFKSRLGDPNMRIFSVLASPDGGVFVGGEFRVSIPRPSGPNALITGFARLLSDGTLDSSFIPTPKLLEGCGVRDLKLSSDGLLYVVGRGLESFEPKQRQVAGITRYRLDGRRDSSFPTNNMQTPDLEVIQLLPDGTILAGGFMGGFLQPFPTLAFGHVDANGVPLNDFLPTTAQAETYVADFARQSDGKVVLGGGFRENGLLIRLQPNGVLDPEFPHCDLVSMYGPSVTKVVPLPDGRILIGGSFELFNGVEVGALVAIQAEEPPATLSWALGEGGNHVSVSWWPGHRSYSLETTTQLSPPTWVPLGFPTVNDHGVQRLELPIDRSQQFLRLVEVP